MTGYKYDVVFRVSAKNGGDAFYWLSDRLTDVGGPLKVAVSYPESKVVREDINRTLRPVVYGVRPEVEITCLILTMSDQLFLSEIEDALLRPSDFSVFISLDGGCVEREVVIDKVSTAEPLQGKTVLGATFKLSLTCVDLIPSRPALMTDPNVGAEVLANGDMETWQSSTAIQPWTQLLGGGNTITQDGSIFANGAYSARLNCATTGANLYLQQDVLLRRGVWYLLSVSGVGSQTKSNGMRVVLRHLPTGKNYLPNGTWSLSAVDLFADPVYDVWSRFTKYVKLDPSFLPNDTFRLYLIGSNMPSGQYLNLDDASIDGPVLRPGYATW